MWQQFLLRTMRILGYVTTIGLLFLGTYALTTFYFFRCTFYNFVHIGSIRIILSYTSKL